MTELRFCDFDPVFTADGEHLAFLSMRSFDPIYDTHVFDMSFPRGCRPYLVPLGAGTPSPFDPQRDGRPVKDAAESDDDHAAAPPSSTVDIEGLPERMVPFPVEAADYSSLQPVAGGVVWLTEPLTGVLGDEKASPDAK
ncbi:MAG: peptidase S41, partial [Sciscionella sp.]